jgi:hypothetical protein
VINAPPFGGVATGFRLLAKPHVLIKLLKHFSIDPFAQLPRLGGPPLVCKGGNFSSCCVDRNRSSGFFCLGCGLISWSLRWLRFRISSARRLRGRARLRRTSRASSRLRRVGGSRPVDGQVSPHFFEPLRTDSSYGHQIVYAFECAVGFAHLQDFLGSSRTNSWD